MTAPYTGFYFPAEWSTHKATWLSWPHNLQTWPDGLMEVHSTMINFIKIVSQGETVCIQVNDESQQQQVASLLAETDVDLQSIKFYKHPTNDAWCRDHGPAFVLDTAHDEKLIVNWGYNAWGGKYPPFELDQAIPQLIGNSLSIPVLKAPLILEGGSVELNGAGTMLTTTCCLLNQNRNPDYSKKEIGDLLSMYYGVTQILWLDYGIAGDDTDGHIDNLARFVNKNTVVAPLEDDQEDTNYQPLEKNFQALVNMKLADGNKLQVIPLPMPNPIYRKGQRLPASYANFYICNAAVLVPTFDDPHDALALDILKGLITDRPVIGLDSRDLIVGLGSFHCLSQQEPHVPSG